MRSAAHGSQVAIGAQDCHAEASGAFTGDISAEMLADAGASAVIVGHSERRTYHHETDATVRAKALAAWRAGLTAIVCVGETKEQRDAGKTLDVVGAQLAGSLPDGATAENLVVAYEPVWAIGTGLTPTRGGRRGGARLHPRAPDARFGAAGAGHPHPLRRLGEALECRGTDGVANVDGALVGGASLKAEDFLGIAAAYALIDPRRVEMPQGIV